MKLQVVKQTVWIRLVGFSETLTNVAHYIILQYHILLTRDTNNLLTSDVRTIAIQAARKTPRYESGIASDCMLFYEH
jgi:hypothetical protein